jgi:hypothetical protein
MGRGYVEYDLPESGLRESVVFSAFIDYRLPDGSRLHIEQQPAWCSVCKRFVTAEEVPSVESLQAEVAKFENGDPETLKCWAFISNGAPVEDRIAELRRRIKWRRNRVSPPRCLDCGSIKITAIPCSGEFTHPETGERVVEVSNGWTDIGSWNAEFSPEGESIR